MNLVQRIQRGGSSSAKNAIDQAFDFDYMGSVEFELGALVRALRALEDAAGDHLQPITADGCVATFVGPIDRVPLAERLFADQLGDRKIRLKHYSDIQRAYGRSIWGKKPETTLTIGWICIDRGEEFALFQHAADAEVWQAALRSWWERDRTLRLRVT